MALDKGVYEHVLGKHGFRIEQDQRLRDYVLGLQYFTNFAGFRCSGCGYCGFKKGAKAHLDALRESANEASHLAPIGAELEEVRMQRAFEFKNHPYYPVLSKEVPAVAPQEELELGQAL